MLSDSYLPISEYALIGNCRTAALVSRHGSIDWYCPGKFDAPAVFCRLLDANRGGYFSVTPVGVFKTERRYAGDTNVLETVHRGDGFEVRVCDFMPLTGEPEHAQSDPPAIHQIVRRIEVVHGEAQIDVRFKPTFDFARDNGESSGIEHGVLAHFDGTWIAVTADGAAFQQGKDMVWQGRLRMEAGDVRFVRLLHADDRARALEAIRGASGEDELRATKAFWESWAQRCSYTGPYHSQVVRSALTLKLLTYDPTGAIVAAPTTSLPEAIGGGRNWDYRFTWLRDSSLILYALLTVSYQQEAIHFIGWLRKLLLGHPRQEPQIMYTIEGGREIEEQELSYLDGYRQSRPVRIGNAAAQQRQLDIYGEVVMAAYIHYHRPEGHQHAPLSGSTGPDEQTWSVLRGLVDDATRLWEQPDNGIWEVRGGPQHFLYSKLMCWAAVDRGLKLADEYGVEADRSHWSSTRDAIRHAIETQGYNEDIGAFTQALGTTALDATALQIPRVGFLPATDPRVLSTIDRIQRDLTRNGLVYRYRNEDGLQGGEGAFLICTFWLIDVLALAGQLDEARKMYDRVLSFANDVGLFSEEIDPRTGMFLGNFPQGFTHLALIRSAVDLAHAHHHGPEDRPTTEGERALHAKRAASGNHHQ
jgi:GH15 family glucan-1,4-alpha-glucosidase